MWIIDYSFKYEPGKEQDRILTTRNGSGGHIVGIFDGHGRSDQMVNTCVGRFPLLLRGVAQDNSKTRFVESFRTLSDETKFLNGGSTATIAYLWNDGSVVAAILGDSPILVRTAHDNVIVGPIHNVATNAEELKAAIRRGALFDALAGRIRAPGTGTSHECSRAFESDIFRPAISTIPELKQARVEPGGWVALMSDGILDTTLGSYATSQGLFIQMVDAGQTAEVIVEHFQPIKRDDASLIICRYSREGELVEGVPGPKHTSAEASLDFS